MGAKSNVAYTRKAQNRSKNLSKLQKSKLMKTRSKMKPTTLVESEVSRQVGGCIRNTHLLDPRKRDNILGSLYKNLRKYQINNFRVGVMTFDGNTVLVAGMSHPRDGIKEMIRKGLPLNIGSVLQKNSFRHILSVHDEASEFNRYKKRVFFPEGVTYVNAPIEDFDLPTPQVTAKIVSFAKNRAGLCQNFVVHCGEGWGRTGTTLAIMYANSDEFKILVEHVFEGKHKNLKGFKAAPRNKCILGHYAEASARCKPKGRTCFACDCKRLTSMVFQAVRTAEKEAGSKRNTGGFSVEVEEQLQFLEKYITERAQELLDEKAAIVERLSHTLTFPSSE